MTVRASLSSALVGCTQAKTSKQAATSDYVVQIHAFPRDCSPVELETSETAKSFLFSCLSPLKSLPKHGCMPWFKTSQTWPAFESSGRSNLHC